ncbi:glycosyltransferase family 39 protein [Streptomyces beijiangensis]|uniref:Glycosyltransferase family 39 protein n=1 Tax=Streptomyces beijiangensis TaxID=163361 RepID=A0A939FAM5_9ACTN|nr:glycosyltransferase 87 family protein [Streptomyces beijiangensis]MBO0515500.1 glycosyltransferase family 39 protein [Streptomyces beijiangensis]
MRPTITASRAALLIALLACAGKLWLASHTFGTGDVRTFQGFAHAVHRLGVADVYAHPFYGRMLYNHPPVTGTWLSLAGAAGHAGIPFPLFIRIPAIAADVGTALLVYAMVDRRAGVRKAVAASVMVSASPVLFMVSGYHGNTDPVFVFFTLLAVYLLADLRRPGPAGIAFALALGVKIVPVVVLPALLVVALLQGRRKLLRFVLGLGGVSLVIWGPAAWYQWSGLRHNVFGYAGGTADWWGLSGLVTALAGHPGDVLQLLQGPGRFAVVALSAGAGALLAYRSPDRLPGIAGLTLALFLCLSTASATQYLAWAAAGLFLVEFWTATLYGITAGICLVISYTQRCGDPWCIIGRTESVRLAFPVWWELTAWLCLTFAVAVGLRLMAAGAPGIRQAAPTRPVLYVQKRSRNAPHMAEAAPGTSPGPPPPSSGRGAGSEAAQ